MQLIPEKETLILVATHCCAIKNVIVASQLYDVAGVQFNVEKEGPIELLQFIQKHNLGNSVSNIVKMLRIFLTIAVSVATRDVEAAISSTASASTPIASASTASASNRTCTLTEPGLYLIYELADKHDYQNQQLTIYKGTLLVKMIA